VTPGLAAFVFSLSCLAHLTTRKYQAEISHPQDLLLVPFKHILKDHRLGVLLAVFFIPPLLFLPLQHFFNISDFSLSVLLMTIFVAGLYIVFLKNA
jgi:hypothetical protein